MLHTHSIAQVDDQIEEEGEIKHYEELPAMPVRYRKKVTIPAGYETNIQTSIKEEHCQFEPDAEHIPLGLKMPQALQIYTKARTQNISKTQSKKLQNETTFGKLRV